MKKEKTGYLLLGLFVGLLIGASIMWWQKSLFKADWLSFKNVRGLVQKLYETPDDVLSQIKTTFSKDKTKFPVIKKGIVSSDSLNNRTLDTVGNDSLNQYNNMMGGGLDYYIEGEPTNDSILYAGGFKPARRHHDTIIADTSHYKKILILKNAGVIVKRDELLHYKIIKVNGLTDSVAGKAYYLDSLLTNDKYTRKIISGQYKIEFWKSPVNYTGYRMSKNKIIVYGILDFNDVALEALNKNLYLRHLSNYYLIENTESFKPLVLVKKPEAITKNRRP